MDKNENTAANADKIEIENMENHPFLQNKVTILNGFSNEEIHKIMQAVRSCFPKGTDLIFAKTTKESLKTVLGDLIIDMSGDHEYLKKNPPGSSPAKPE